MTLVIASSPATAVQATGAQSSTSPAVTSKANPFAEALAGMDPQAQTGSPSRHADTRPAHGTRSDDAHPHRDTVTSADDDASGQPAQTTGTTLALQPPATLPSLPDPSQPRHAGGGSAAGETGPVAPGRDVSQRGPQVTPPLPGDSPLQTGPATNDDTPASQPPPAASGPSGQDEPSATTNDQTLLSHPADTGGALDLIVAQTVPVETRASEPAATHETAATGHASTATPLTSQVAPAIMTLVGGSGQPGQIVLHLSPDTLGTVRVTLSRDAAGHTTLTFEAGRPETLHALAGEVGQLRHAVNEAGLGEHSPVEVTFRQESIAPVRPVDTDNTLSMSFDDRQQHHAQATEHSAGLNDAFTSSGNNSGGSEHGSFGRPDRTQRDRSRMPGMGEGMSVTWPDRATALAAGSRPVNITV